jgi:predicted ester cyclase
LAPQFAGYKQEHTDQDSTRDYLKRGLAMVLNAFPDYHQTIHDWIAEGDKVMARWTTRGTHLGIYNGIAPTGKVIHEHGIDIFQIADSQIIAHWVELDLLGILRQMGFDDPLKKR